MTFHRHTIVCVCFRDFNVVVVVVAVSLFSYLLQIYVKLMMWYIACPDPDVTFTCLKSTTEKREQWNLFKFGNIDTRMTWRRSNIIIVDFHTLFWCCRRWLLTSKCQEGRICGLYSFWMLKCYSFELWA